MAGQRYVLRGYRSTSEEGMTSDSADIEPSFAVVEMHNTATHRQNRSGNKLLELSRIGQQSLTMKEWHHLSWLIQSQRALHSSLLLPQQG
mmetsp:Transcript_633/g.663  ORF Transcript_633/g.663 Transcript_633/m.663 type:complete len:90 (+) Transcript_633:767-1036(+)